MQHELPPGNRLVQYCWHQGSLPVGPLACLRSLRALLSRPLPLSHCPQAMTIDSEASAEELGWHRYRPPPEQVPQGSQLQAGRLCKCLSSCCHWLSSRPVCHPATQPPAHIVQLLQEMRRVEVQRAAEPAAPGLLSQQQQWEAAAAGAHLGRSQSETRRGGMWPEGAQGAEHLRVEPRAWSIAY